MPVPKKRHSKGRVRRKRNSHYFKRETQPVKTKVEGVYKRPHVEEKVEI